MPVYEFECPQCCCTDCTGYDTPSGLTPCCDWWGLASLVLYVEGFTYGGVTYGNLCFTLQGNGCGVYTYSGTSTIRTETGLPVTIPATTIDYRCALTASATKTWHARVTVGSADMVEFSQEYSCGLCAGPSVFNPVEWLSPDNYGERHFITDTFGSGESQWSVTWATLGAGSCCNCETEPDTCVPADPETWTGPACCPWQTLIITYTDPDGVHGGSHAMDYGGTTGGLHYWASRSCCTGFILLMLGECDDTFLPQWRLTGPDSGMGFTQQLYSPSCCSLFFCGDGCGRQYKIGCSDCDTYDEFGGGIYCVDDGAGGRDCQTLTAAQLPPASPAWAVGGPVGQDPETGISSGPCFGCDSIDTCSGCCGGSSGVPNGGWVESESGCCEADFGGGVVVLSAGPTITVTLAGGAVYSDTVEDCCGTHTLPLVSGEGDPTYEVSITCCEGPGPVPVLAGWNCNEGSGNCTKVFEPNVADYEDRSTCEAECLKHGYACLPLTGCTEGDYDPDTTTVYLTLGECEGVCTVEGWRCVDGACVYDAAWPDDGATTYATEGDCGAACIVHGWQCIDGECLEDDYTLASGTTYADAGDCAVACCPGVYSITIGSVSCSDANGTWTVSASGPGWVGMAGGSSTVAIRPAVTSCSPDAQYEVYWTDGANWVSWCLDDWDGPGGCGECVSARAGAAVGCEGATFIEVCPSMPFAMAPAPPPAPTTPPVQPAQPFAITRPPATSRGGRDCGCRKGRAAVTRPTQARLR